MTKTYEYDIVTNSLEEEKGGEMSGILTHGDLEAIVHALYEELNRVIQSGGNQYGPLTPSALEGLVERLRTFRDRGENYILARIELE